MRFWPIFLCLALLGCEWLLPVELIPDFPDEVMIEYQFRLRNDSNQPIEWLAEVDTVGRDWDFFVERNGVLLPDSAKLVYRVSGDLDYTENSFDSVIVCLTKLELYSVSDTGRYRLPVDYQVDSLWEWSWSDPLPFSDEIYYYRDLRIDQQLVDSLVVD